MARDEGIGAEAGGAQSRFRPRQLERIDVDADQPPAWLHGFQDRLRVRAAAERAVDRHLAGCRLKAAKHFSQHDRSVRVGQPLTPGRTA